MAYGYDVLGRLTSVTMQVRDGQLSLGDSRPRPGRVPGPPVQGKGHTFAVTKNQELETRNQEPATFSHPPSPRLRRTDEHPPSLELRRTGEHEHEQEHEQE